MDDSWKDYEPAPIEYLHAQLEILFWEAVKDHGVTGGKEIIMTGGHFHKIIGEAKTRTYEKYKKMDLRKAIKKVDLI